MKDPFSHSQIQFTHGKKKYTIKGWVADIALAVIIVGTLYLITRVLVSTHIIGEVV